MKELSPEEGQKLFELSALRNLGITAEEFIDRWEAGRLKGRKAERVSTLLPRADRCPSRDVGSVNPN